MGRIFTLQNYKLFTILLLIVSLLSSSLEAILYKGLLTKYFSLNTDYLIVVSLAALLLLRIYIRIPHRWISGFFISSVFLLIIASIMGFIDQLYYNNFIFSIVSVHPDLVAQLGVQLGLYFLISLSPTYVKKCYKLVLVLFPLWVLSLVTIFWLFHPSIYSFFKLEDSAIEYFTFGAYSVSAILGFQCIQKVRKDYRLSNSSRFILIGVFFFFVLGSLFVAGEEVSWGQRLIGFHTPDAIKEKNEQNEFNVHNIPLFMNSIYILYGTLSLLTLISKPVTFSLMKVIPSKTPVKILYFLSPPYHLFMFFLVVFIFSLSRLVESIPEYPNYPEETIEFILSAGILLAVYEIKNRIFYTVKSYKQLHIPHSIS